MTDEKVGIELLKDLTTDVVKVIKKVTEAKADDDKISKMEIIGMIPSIAAVGKDLLKFNAIVVEVKDIDSAERKELLEHIISLDIVGDKAEIILVNVVELVEGEIALYNNNVVPIINVFKK